MLIESRTNLSGLIRTIGLPVTEEQIEAWENGVKIQEAMPNLNASQKHFILQSVFKNEYDDEPYEYFSD